MSWLVLRPEPGATATARRIAALGQEAVVAPLFAVEPIAWAPPVEPFDAVMLTSANAVRAAGPMLARYRALPAYAVGAATAAALRDAGFEDVRSGDGDVEALLDRIAGDGRRALLHPAGEDRREASRAGIAIARVTVYRARAATALPPRAAAAVASGTVALLHSPRAASLFSTLVTMSERDRVAIAAISPAALAAAAAGWRATMVAASPDDDALLAAATALCEGA